MRDAAQKRYDKKSRMCRVLLADYLAIKALSKRAGITMAEAFHNLLTKRIEPEPAPKPATEPAPVAVPISRVSAPIFLRVRSHPALQVSSHPAIAVNGNKAGVLVIKPKGGKING